MTSKSEWYDPDRKVEDKEVEFKQEVQGVPYSKEEVEDEVLDALGEGKEECDDDEGCVTAISPQLYAAVQPVEDSVPVSEEKPKKKRTDNEKRALTSNLRKLDDAHNRTCGNCLKRLPIDKFPRLKKSEVCEDCE